MYVCIEYLWIGFWLPVVSGLAVHQGCTSGIEEVPMVSLYTYFVPAVYLGHVGQSGKSLCGYFELSWPHWGMSGLGFKDQFESFQLGHPLLLMPNFLPTTIDFDHLYKVVYFKFLHFKIPIFFLLIK